MNDLLSLRSFLASALLADPVLALACTAVWLDPIAITDADPDVDEETLQYALSVCRSSFREVYVGAVQRLWQGVDNTILDRLICDGINQHLVAVVTDLDQLRYGVPFEAQGIDPDDFRDGMNELHPGLVKVAAWFGVPDRADMEEAGPVADRLVKSLQSYGEHGPHAEIANLLRWLFGISGNTLVDATQDMVWDSGIEPVDWTPDDIAFMNEVQTEANTIIASAVRALDLLDKDATWAEALERNIHLMKDRRSNDGRPSLQWPGDPGRSPSDAAESHA